MTDLRIIARRLNDAKDRARALAQQLDPSGKLVQIPATATVWPATDGSGAFVEAIVWVETPDVEQST